MVFDVEEKLLRVHGRDQVFPHECLGVFACCASLAEAVPVFFVAD
jgi:hypothetical protein